VKARRCGVRRDEALAILATHRHELEQFGVETLAVFGSVARDEAGPDSDVDVLVEFNRPIGLFEYVRLRDRLAELMGRPVDLVTPDALRPGMRDRVLEEAVSAAARLEAAT
jgi:predicted nucleotidyltransferase